MILKQNNLNITIYTMILLLAFGLTANAAFSQGDEGLDPLTDRVKQAISNLPYYTVFDALSVEVDGTTAIISGKVTNPVLKNTAEAAARKVSDIQEVENNIEVLPFSPNDDRIRLDVYRSIYYHPDFTRYATRAYPPIHIIVNNGDVHLEGVVGTEADKTLARIRANSVPGVFSVTNNLRVERD